MVTGQAPVTYNTVVGRGEKSLLSNAGSESLFGREKETEIYIMVFFRPVYPSDVTVGQSSVGIFPMG